MGSIRGSFWGGGEMTTFLSNKRVLKKSYLKSYHEHTILEMEKKPIQLGIMEFRFHPCNDMSQHTILDRVMCKVTTSTPNKLAPT
jgi:hypothetical protein